MQLRLSFPTLLASVLLASYPCAQDIFVNAHPLARSTGTVTLPIRRVPQRSGNVHPHIYLQQHINRSHKRLARVTGREPSPDHELRARILKRLADIEDQDNVGRARRSGLIQVNGVHKANKPTTNNSLGIDILAVDAGYVATLQIGTPPKDFSLIVDSGSTDLWVGAENCHVEIAGAPGCGTHAFLGHDSSTFIDTGTPFSDTYGVASDASTASGASGTIVRDNIVIAGLQLISHTFGAVQLETITFSDSPFDGVLGLAKSNLSAQKTLTVVEVLALQGKITKGIVSYKLSREADNKNDGQITFGASDESKFDLSTRVDLANVNQQGFWEADMGGVTVDGQDTQLQGRTAVLDTGTSLIIAPPQDAQAVHALITGAQSDGNGGFFVPCEFNQIVAMSFGGRNFEIDPRDMLFGGRQPVAQDPQTGEDLCQSGISEGTFGGPTEWLVGNVFLKNAYFITNLNSNLISLAKLR